MKIIMEVWILERVMGKFTMPVIWSAIVVPMPEQAPTDFYVPLHTLGWYDEV